jgi:ferredoxin
MSAWHSSCTEDKKEETVGAVERKRDRTWPIRRSTRAFYREGKTVPGYSFVDWLHGYVYTRWPYLYIGVAVGGHPLARVLSPVVALFSRLFWSERPADGTVGRPAEAKVGRPDAAGDAGAAFADTYHGKVVPVESAKRLISVDHAIELRDLEQVIPYTQARDIVLQDPDHIVVLDCPCRAARAEPCLPLDVCLIVGEPFASFVIEHHANRSRWITQQEAVEIIEAEHERGHVHHAFFKDAMLGRYYAICNCCSCCCGAMQAWRSDTPMLASSGYVSQVQVDRCRGCGDCAAACPFDAISVRDERSVIDLDACMGCGVCVDKCEQGALSLVRDPSKGEPLEISVLLEAAAMEAGLASAIEGTGPA